MKKVKYITSAILIIVVMVFIGEFYVLYLDSFDLNFSYVTMYLQKETSQQEMISDIQNAATNNDVGVFIVDRQVDSIFSTTMNIYGSEEVDNYLSEKSNIRQGEYKSVFLGNVTVEVYSLNDINDISNLETYSLIGSKDDKITFKQDLIDKYAGKFPQPAGTNDEIPVMVGIWLLVVFLILLMTLYEVALMKKEVVVRLVSGEQLSHFIMKNIIRDIAVYSMLLMLSMSIVGMFSEVFYLFSITITVFVIFLIVNSLLYCTMFFTDFKRDIASKQNAKTTLKIGYAYKTTVIVITLIAMSGNVALIWEGVNYYQQKDFFENHSTYSYAMVYAERDPESKYGRELYKRCFASGDNISLVNLESWGSDTEYVFANKGAIQYLSQQIRDFDFDNLQEKVYFLIPSSLGTSDRVLREAEEIWTSYYEGDADEIIAVEYTGENSILAVSTMGKITSTLKKKPVIILSNLSGESYDKFWNLEYIMNSSMLRIPQGEWEKFINENSLQNDVRYLTNCYENYMFQWTIAQRSMVIGIVLFAILLLMNMVIIRSVLQYEYDVNAKELTLKKILGYGLLQRQKMIFIMTAVSGAIGMTGAVILCLFLESSAWWQVLASGVLVLLVEVVFTVYYSYKMDNINIQRILKGGSL